MYALGPVPSGLPRASELPCTRLCPASLGPSAVGGVHIADSPEQAVQDPVEVCVCRCKLRVVCSHVACIVLKRVQGLQNTMGAVTLFSATVEFAIFQQCTPTPKSAPEPLEIFMSVMANAQIG